MGRASSQEYKSYAAYVLEEDLENTTSLLVDKTRDTLDTATAGKMTNIGLSDTYHQS